MLIKSIKICNFRNLKEKEVYFSPDITILLGDNAVGKTTILEAVCCLSSIKSFRTTTQHELINCSEHFCYLEGEVEKTSKIQKISFYFDFQHKKVKLNNFFFRKLSDYLGFFNVVYFSALDFLKLKGSSSERRNIFDLVFCQISKDYLHSCNCYKKFLKDRNALLKSLSFENKEESLEVLVVVTEQLCLYGNKIIEYRKKMCSMISEFAKGIHSKISNSKELFELQYSPSLDSLTIYDYKQLYKEDLNKGFTNKGPHRDDYIFIINNKNVAIFGSQGQQRNAMLSVKLAIADLIFQIKKEAPTLLLDDVFSELDKNRQNALISNLNPNYQTIITTSSISDLDKNLLDKALLVRLENRSE